MNLKSEDRNNESKIDQNHCQLISIFDLIRTIYISIQQHLFSKNVLDLKSLKQLPMNKGNNLIIIETSETIKKPTSTYASKLYILMNSMTIKNGSYRMEENI